MNTIHFALPDLAEPLSAGSPAALSEDSPSEEQVPADPTEYLEAALGRSLWAHEARYLTGPLILYSYGWGETIPAWLCRAIPKARMAQLVAEAAAGAEECNRMCSLEEVTAYLYTACLSVPLAWEWANVYLWVLDRVLRTHGRLPEGQTVWDLIDPGAEPGPYCGELSEYGRRECLDRLRRDIRHAVVRHQRCREHAARRVCQQT
jgi:hypothetical protein